ncbi:hypothetical protein RN001_010822 [Aquatica leii]|uniref:Fucosyltransferase n=1 Tax=Aquatica leii TaxID=1421715 RepID=A0AAN7PAG1_9COLE|nr:hypothetical protein RN001_010822 [Aquatica leii]
MVSKLVKIFAITTVLLILYTAWSSKNQNILRKSRVDHSQKDIKYILFWTPFFEKEDYFIGFGSEPFNKCDYKNCFFTNNRSFLSVDKFDAIMFNGNIYDKNRHKEPSVRNQSQVYIYVNRKSPVYTPSNIKFFNSFYNWTMTYRHDSEVQFPYNEVIKKDTNYVLPSMDSIKNKTKMMAWFASNCHTPGKREVLVNKLKNNISIDIYGRCGTMQCAQNERTWHAEECLDLLEKNYKFYLAAENSLCKDYASEKLYAPLRKNVIPVVYSGANYTKIAPPNSVINVGDFNDVPELVNYLKFLDANPIEYLKYFEWKKHYMIVEKQTVCKLCQKLNEPIVTKVIKDLHQWTWGPNNEICKQLPKIVQNLL